MIDFSKEVVSALGTILPTHYEMTLTSKTQTPCISYMILNDICVTETNGATLGYSRLTYQVKVWSNKVADLQRYAKEVDSAMRTLGFKRISSGELYDNNSTMIQKIMTFEALALEEFE